MTTGKNLALLLARLGMASLFVFSGTEKLVDPSGAAGFAASFGVPLADYAVPVAALFEIACGLMIASGWHARAAAIALAAWMAVLNPWFHPFWKVPAPMWQLIIDSFFHHFVMIGGMIYLAVFGPGNMVIAKSPQ